MGHQNRRDSPHQISSPVAGDSDLQFPFGKLDGIDNDDLRDTAYEIFFTACRSSPGFGGRNALSYYPSDAGGGDGGGGFGAVSPARGNNNNSNSNSNNGVGMMSRTKRALGLKTMIRRSHSRRTHSMGGTPSSPQAAANGGGGGSPGFSFTVPGPIRSRRPMTSAEIMRQQMKVTEQSDNRLRKTLMRTLVGQMGRRPETIILPLELLRHLKPSEFNDSCEYHIWQKRQLKILEAGLLLQPSIPLDKSNTFALRFRDIIRSSESKPIDTSRNSESMRTLCNCVVSLSWRTHDGSTTESPHWADGYPLNLHIYTTLLRSIFDLKDDTLVLDEVDELLDLIKKTWSTLGISKPIHNLCFTWVLFSQYVATGQVEGDLLCASLAMLNEVASNVKRAEREEEEEADALYMRMVSGVLKSMKRWSEKRLMCYHESFRRGNVGLMENLLPLVFGAAKILEEDVEKGGVAEVAGQEKEKGDVVTVDFSGNRVDHYIRSSMKFAFAKLLENGSLNGMTLEVQEVTEALIQLAKETEALALKEKMIYSPVLKKWHPIAASVTAVTLHSCYGTLLKQYLAGTSSLTNEMIAILERAGKLEKFLVQMVVEDSVDCEDGGKTIVKEMVLYEVDSIILNLLKEWIQERLKKGKECLQRAKETETWNPKSKTEPYAQSAGEIMKVAKETVDSFFEIPLGMSEDLVHELANGLEHLIREYTTFVASCGSKQSYIPTLPPLTRCSRDSKFFKLWKKASPCSVGVEDIHLDGSNEGHHPRPSTSRGTQRLYIRLNTLHYLLSHLNSLDKSLTLSPHLISTTSPHNHHHHNHHRRRSSLTTASSSYFDLARSTIQSATQHVSEVAAYRLIFLDSNSVFFESLYAEDVENSRIKPALRILKQNLTLLSAIVTDRAQPLAMKEVMKASFEAFLTVLLAGGSSRIFNKTDHQMIEEDFESLKRVFCACGEGLIAEDVVEREAEMVEGVVALMGQSTEQLVEDFSIVACEASGIGIVGGQKLPMPPTTGRWNRSDPNTILRVLCHRNDRSANHFLKSTFQLAKRR